MLPCDAVPLHEALVPPPQADLPECHRRWPLTFLSLASALSALPCPRGSSLSWISGSCRGHATHMAPPFWPSGRCASCSSLCIFGGRDGSRGKHTDGRLHIRWRHQPKRHGDQVRPASANDMRHRPSGVLRSLQGLVGNAVSVARLHRRPVMPTAEERYQAALLRIADGSSSPRLIAQNALGSRRLCDTDFVDAYHCRSEECRRTGTCRGVREKI